MSRVRFLPAVVLLLATAGRVSAQQSQSPATAPLIDSILIVTGDVFQPEEVEVNPAFGVMNTLHIKTRANVVRRELLFSVGEPYDSARVAETRRNLNRLALFRGVIIDTARIDGKLTVVVGTFDSWTTSLGLNARSTGGTFTWSVVLSEANLLGTGNSGSLGYYHDVDRNSVTATGNVRRLLGTGADGGIVYRNFSDGDAVGVAVQSPFRSLSDRKAVSVRGNLASVRVLQFRDGERFDSLHREFQLGEFGATVAPVAGTRGYVRVGLVGQVKNETFQLIRGPIPAIPDTVTGAIGLTADLRRARFMVVTHYNGFARDEDIDLSARVQAATILAPSAFGYARSGVGLSLSLQTGVPLGRSFVKFFARSNGLFTSAGLDSGQVVGSFTAALRPLPRQASIFFVSAGRLKNAPPGFEYDLGHNGGGPRAFGPHAYNGTRMAWGTLEHRVFVLDEVLSVFGVGFAAFVDYGGAWYDDQPPRKGGNVGFGLRLGPTRATGTNLGRFDLAYKFGDGIGPTDKRWVFSFGRSLAY